MAEFTGLLGDALGYMQDPVRTPQMRILGGLLSSSLTSLDESDKRYQALYKKAFSDKKNPMRVTDPDALAELTSMTMSGPMGMANAGVTKLASTKVLGYDPQTLATRYPLVAPGVAKVDPKTGKEFIGKQLSAEAEAVSKARKAAQKDIDAGRYTPYYDVAKRDYVDPMNYPLQGRTLTDIVPAKAETVAKYQAIYDTPQARANLAGAYEKAASDPLAQNWYAMKQYEDDFIKQFGEERGRQMFKERFADAMASTTGGADPTSNYLMAQYGNYLRQQGVAQPTAAVDFPFPIGGRFASGNMALYDKIINQGQGLTVQNPKRFNFSSNFMGHLDRPTIDEQMSQLYQGGLLAPFPNTYGIAEGVLNDVAKSKGVMPVNLQDVAWIGAKGTTGKPMIQNINEAIERTSRVTGLPQDEALKLMIRSGIPTY
jgi:hypothetical protein